MAHVVLVGDETGVRGAIARMLAEREISVVAADDAADAIAQMAAMERAPDLVLLDRAAPTSSATTACSRPRRAGAVRSSRR